MAKPSTRPISKKGADAYCEAGPLPIPTAPAPSSATFAAVPALR